MSCYKQRLAFLRAKLRHAAGVYEQSPDSENRVSLLLTYSQLQGFLEALVLSGVMDETKYLEEVSAIEAMF